MKKATIVDAPCSDCLRETRHEIVKRHVTEGGDREDGVWWTTVFTMLECRGCGFISLKREFKFSEYTEATVQYFPPPVTRRIPDWVQFCFAPNDPQNRAQLFNEVYSALYADNRMLAAMGCRTLIDLVMCEKVGDIGRFTDKLKKMKELGFISDGEQGFLDAAVDKGSAAAHRGHCPKYDELIYLIEIVEHLYNKIYVLPDLGKELKKTTPPRPTQPKKTK